VRTGDHAIVQELAEHSGIPVINMLTARHHPCQALADLLTLREHFGSLEGLRVAYVGDANNVSRSLADAGALAGMEVVVAAPPDDPFEAVRGAQAVYTDVWVSMGDAADERDERLQAFTPYRVDPAVMAAASPEAVFLHCLPAHRGEEVAPSVIDSRRSLVFEQAENRMHTAQGLLLALTSGGFELRSESCRPTLLAN